MKLVKVVLWLLRQRWPSKMSRYTFLWGTVHAVAAAAAAPSPEAVHQQGLSGGAQVLQSSHEMWSQQAWPLDRYLLCLNRPDSGEQVLSMLQSSHLLEETTTTHPKPLIVLHILASSPRLLGWLSCQGQQHWLREAGDELLTYTQSHGFYWA